MSEELPSIAYTHVFDRGAHGYHTFRIPAVCAANEGTLLAFAEGRVNSASDDGDIDLVLKRSSDGGATWGPLQVVADDGPHKFGNPVPIVDRRSGRIHLLSIRTGGDVTARDIFAGLATAEQTRRPFVQHSDDHGATWSAARETAVKPPDWRHFVVGPGHGIQLRSGAHAGRLLAPANQTLASVDGETSVFGGSAIYSDDDGETWRLGAVDIPRSDVINPNESTAAELVDGTIYFNARNERGQSPATRAATISVDGGETFATPYQPVDSLSAPVVQGSVIAHHNGDLVFSSPLHPTERRDLTLRYSSDDGATWSRDRLIHRGRAAYSDLVALTDSIGVLYEGGTESAYDHIIFAHLPDAD